ncbi:MAG: hypothetical protein ACOCRK_07080 [bacterium]
MAKLLLNLIRSGSFITVSKPLIIKLGLNGATILCELLSMLSYYDENNQLRIEDGEKWFFCTIKELYERTSLKRSAQDKAIDKLIDLNLIKKDQKGRPAKRYFCCNDKKIEEFIIKSFQDYDKLKDKEGRHTGKLKKLTKINNDTNTPKENLGDSYNHQRVENRHSSLSKNNKLECRKQANIYKNNTINNNFINDDDDNKLSDNLDEKLKSRIESLFKEMFKSDVADYHWKKIFSYNFNNDMLFKDINKCYNHNAHSFKYLTCILDGWKEKGYEDVSDITNNNKSNKAKKYTGKVGGQWANIYNKFKNVSND